MARRKLTDTSHPDLTLTDEYWLAHGDQAQPPMRLKILYVTMEEVARTGPGSFNVANVCDRLGVTYPMVNHYYGNRDGLLAEAAHMVYERFVDDVWVAVERAPKNPRDRLAAWIRAEISETAAMGGWSSILNYPLSAREVSEVIYSSFGQQMSEAFELNMGRLALLVRDVRAGEVTDVLYRRGRVPREELLADPELQALVPTIVWSTFGAAVWTSGQHLPSRKVPEIGSEFSAFLENHINRVIEMVTDAPAITKIN